MKMFIKMITIALIALLITGCALNAPAATSDDHLTTLDDSLHIPEDIRLQIELADTEFVFKEYLLFVTDCFRSDIDGKTAISSTDKYSYAVADANGQLKYRYMLNPDGGLIRLTLENFQTYSWERRAIQEMFEGTAIKRISPDIQIKCTYYVHEKESIYEGAVIYYETNYGEFVYYSGVAGGEYLMPLSAFNKFVDEMLEIMATLPPGAYFNSISEKWSMYNINSDAFNPDVYLAGGNNQIVLWTSLCVVLLSAGIVAVVLVYHRRKRRIIEQL